MFIITKKVFARLIILQNPTKCRKLMPTMMTLTHGGVIALLGKKCLGRLGVHKAKKCPHDQTNNNNIQQKRNHNTPSKRKINSYYIINLELCYTKAC